MKKHCKKEELLLKRIEDTRQQMIQTSTLHPLHSNEVVMISQNLDNLLNELRSINEKD